MFLGKGNYNDFGTSLDLRQDNDFKDTTVKIKKISYYSYQSNNSSLRSSDKSKYNNATIINSTTKIFNSI